jgi:hypothetical protein
MINKYQQGGRIIQSRDTFTRDSLADNQQEVIDPFPDIQDSVVPSTSSDPFPDIQDNIQEEETQEQRPQREIPWIEDQEQDLHNTLQDPQNRQQREYQDKVEQARKINADIEKRNKDLTDLYRAVGIPDNVDPRQIKIEDVVSGEHGITNPYKKATFPDGKVQYFTDDATLQDYVSEFGNQVVGQAVVKGTMGILEIGNQVIRKSIRNVALAPLDFISLNEETTAGDLLDWQMNQVDKALGIELTEEEKFKQKAQGLIFSPFTDRIAKLYKDRALKIAPDDEYLKDAKELREKMAAGDVNSIISEPLFWQKMFTDKTMLETLYPGLESVGEFMIPGTVVAKAAVATKALKAIQANRVGTLAKLGQAELSVGQTIGGVIGDIAVGSLTSSALESHFEGNHNAEHIAVEKYNQEIAKNEFLDDGVPTEGQENHPANKPKPIKSLAELIDAPDSQAKADALLTYKDSYRNIFNANLVPLTVMNALPIMSLAGKMGKLAKVGTALTRTTMQYPITSGAITTVVSGGFEGWQENMQSGIEAYETKKQLNGLYPIEDAQFDGIWGTLKDVGGGIAQGARDFNKDENNTVSTLLGIVLGGGTVAPTEIMNAYNQFGYNKKAKKVLSKYASSDFSSILGITNKGQIDIPTLASKVNSFNNYVINDELQEVAERTKDPDLIEYAYKQAASGVVYDAYNSGLDKATAREGIRKIVTEAFEGQKVVEDSDGTMKNTSEIIERRMSHIDDLFKISEHVAKLKKEYSLPEKHAQALYSNLIGERHFSKLFDNLSEESKNINREIQQRKQSAQELKDLEKNFGEEISEDALTTNVEFTTPLNVLRARRHTIRGKLAKVADIVTKYQTMTEALSLDKENVHNYIVEGRQQRIKDSVERATKEATGTSSKEVVKNAALEVIKENPESNVKEVVDEVKKAVDNKNVLLEESLANSLPETASQEGMTYKQIVNPPHQITPAEKDIREKLYRDILADQRAEANTVSPQERYAGRPLLFEQEAIDKITNLTPEEFELVNQKFLESKQATDIEPFKAFLTSDAENRFQDKDYREIVKQLLIAEKASNASTPKVENETANHDRIEAEKQRDAVTANNATTVVSVPYDIDQILKELNEREPELGITDSEKQRRNKELVQVLHETPLSGFTREQIKTLYTTTAQDWYKGVSYIHLGLLTPGDLVTLEVEPGLSHNASIRSWKDLSVQVVSYPEGKRVVLGMLAFYNENTATEQLETIRKDIFTQYIGDPNSHVKSKWTTPIQEIYKGKIETLNIPEGELEQRGLRTGEVVKDAQIPLSDIEIGLAVSAQHKPEYIATNGVKFEVDVTSKTTGFFYLLIKSHKAHSTGEKHHETFRLFTRQVQAVKGYREALLKALNNPNIELGMADAQMLTRQKNKGNKEIPYGPTWKWDKELNQPYIETEKLGKKTKIVGAENIYNELKLGEKPVHIQYEWIKNWSPVNKIKGHPVYGNVDLKKLIFEVTNTDIDPTKTQNYEYEGQSKPTLFKDAKFSVEDFYKDSKGIEGVEIIPVTPEVTPATPSTSTRKIINATRPKRKLKIGSRERKTLEDPKKSQQWFKSRLEEIGYIVSDSELEKLHGLLKLRSSDKIFGLAKDAAVTLASNRPDGTTRHEAFHIVFNLFLTSKQREQAFREVWNEVKNTNKFKKYSQEEFENALKDELFGDRSKYSIGEDNEVKYVLKASNILASDKAIDWFKKRDKAGWKGDLFYEKLSSELGIPKDQVEILKSLNTSNPYNREELLTTLLANYSYTVEANVSRRDPPIMDIDVDEFGDSFLSNTDPVGNPTQHYSNMTVPGGTNYTEVEIATPAIEPSIKGHAQFASKNGIGWFRSDEKAKDQKVSILDFEGRSSILRDSNADGSFRAYRVNDINNDFVTGNYEELGTFKNEEEFQKVFGTPTKTRRILEIQSDLFQKGRESSTLIFDKNTKFDHSTKEEFEIAKKLGRKEDSGSHNVIAYVYNKDTYIYDIEDNEYRIRRDADRIPERKNQFLQLLNKDNNWVTFFVKSIIQDSVKKGYEKVLFPSGDTASKVEGHSTLEEFKRRKEERIKELENNSKNIIENIKKIKSNKTNHITLQRLINEIGDRELRHSGYPIGNGEKVYYNSETDVIWIGDNTKSFETKRITEKQLEELDLTERLLYVQESNLTHNDAELSQLESELKQIEGPEGLAAFAPINFFYENTLQNILKKNYKVNRITDEYGNQWFEVELNEEVKAQTETIKLKTSGEKYYQKQGLLTQLEEVMAEGFEFRKNSPTFPEWINKYPKLKKILEELYNFLFRNFDILKQYFTDSRSLEDLYRQIDNNSLGRNFLGQRRKSYTEVLNTNLLKNTSSKYSIKSIPNAYIAQRISGINKDRMDELFTTNEIFKSLEEGKGNQTLHDFLDFGGKGFGFLPLDRIKFVYTKIKELNQEYIDSAKIDLQEAIQSSDQDLIEDKQYIVDNLTIENDLINIDYIESYIRGEHKLSTQEDHEFTRRILKDLKESQGVIVKLGGIVTQREIAKSIQEAEDAATYEDDFAEESEGVGAQEITKDEMDSRESWQRDIFSENSFERISPRVKREIAKVPVKVKIPNTELYQDATDDLGRKVYHNPRVIFDILVEKISSSRSKEEMLTKLKALRDKDPKIDSIMARIDGYNSHDRNKFVQDLWLGIGNKYKMKHLMNLSRGRKVNIFDSNTKGVIPKIMTHFTNNFNSLNWNLADNTRLNTIGQLTYEEFALALETTDFGKRAEIIPKLLHELGFEISEETVDYFKNNTAEKNNKVFDNIKYIFRLMTENINPTNFINTDGQGGAHGKIKEISEALRDSDPSIDMKMFTNGKNKLVSGHVTAGFIIKYFHALRNDILLNKDPDSRAAAIEDFEKENNFLFYNESPFYSWIYAEGNELGKDNLSLELAFMDSRKRNNTQVGSEITDMHKGEMTVNKFEYWIGGLNSDKTKQRSLYNWSKDNFRNTWYNVAIFDSPKTYFLKMPVLERREDLIGEFFKVWKQENSRINYLKRKKEENSNFSTGNENLDQNGHLYHFFAGAGLEGINSWEAAREILFGEEGKNNGWIDRKFQEYAHNLKDLGLVNISENGEISAKKGGMPALTVDGLNLAFPEVLKLYWMNEFLMNTQTITMLSGDLAMYKKDKDGAYTFGDYQKRNKQAHANGIYGDFQEALFSVVYLKDEYRTSRSDFTTAAKEYLAKHFRGDALKQVTKHLDEPHNITDAQGYITLDRWREIMQAFGKWAPKFEEMYNRLSTGEGTQSDLFVVSQPIKPQYFGWHLQEGPDKNLKFPTQYKYSAIVLHKDLTDSNPTLKAIADQMKAHTINEVIFESGVKVGRTDDITLKEFLSGVKNDTPLDMAGVIQMANNKYYKSQQEVTEHFVEHNTSNLLGIQFRKLIRANLNKNSPIKSKRSKDLLAVLKVLDSSVDKLKSDLLGDDLLTIIDNLQALNIKDDRIALGELLNDIGEFRARLLDSIDDKFLGSQYIKALDMTEGRFNISLAHPVVSRKFEEIISSWYKKVSKQTHHGASYVNASSLGYDEGEHGLQIKFEKDGTFYVEIAIPKGKQMMGLNMETGVEEEVKEGIVYRIPTEEKYSMFPVKVVKWLEPSVGGIIIMPIEVTTLAGLDFDIDKVYAIQYNYSVKSGKIKVPRNITSRKGRENLLLDSYLTILQDSNTFKDFIRKQDIEPLKDLRKTLGKHRYIIESAALPQAQTNYLARNQAGRDLIGIFANNNSFHALIQYKGVGLPGGTLNKLLTGNLEKYRGVVSGIFGSENDLTERTKEEIKLGFNATQISRSFAMLLAASVDNAKDPILDDLNVNTFTAPILAMLLHLGIPLNEAIIRINEQDVLDATLKFYNDGPNEALEDEVVADLHNAAKSVGKVVSVLRIDSGVGPIFHDVDKKISDIIDVNDDPNIITAGLLPTIQSTQLEGKVHYEIVNSESVDEATKEYVQILLDEINLVSKWFPYFNDSFINVKTKLSQFKKKGNSISSKNRRKADLEHMAIIHYNLFDIRNPDGSKDTKRFIEEFPMRFTNFMKEFRKVEEGESLEAKAYFKLFNPFTVNKENVVSLFDKNSIDKQEQELISEQWVSAIESQDEEVRTIANDLIKYGFIINGYHYTRDSYFHLTPIEFYMKVPGFNDFEPGPVPDYLKAFFIAINHPDDFLPTMYDEHFDHNNAKDLKELVIRTVTDNGEKIDYYAPMYAKREANVAPDGSIIDYRWDVYINEEYRTSGFTKTDGIMDKRYNLVAWKDDNVKGRTYDIDNFGLMNDLQIKTKELPDNKTVAEAPVKPKHVVKLTREYTPENITFLAPNEVFVFGSNSEGVHGKGAALLAKQRFGAIQGQSEGLQGQSYAVITKKDWRVEKSSTLNEIGKGIQDMLLFAKENPTKRFLVTKLGSSLAGYTTDEIKGLFEKLVKFIPDNVILPKEYEVRGEETLDLGEDNDTTKTPNTNDC